MKPTIRPAYRSIGKALRRDIARIEPLEPGPRGGERIRIHLRCGHWWDGYLSVNRPALQLGRTWCWECGGDPPPPSPWKKSLKDGVDVADTGDRQGGTGDTT